jgi:serine/threonine-protein kinase RsbW
MDYNLKVRGSIDSLKEIRSFVSKRLHDLSVPELEINMMVLAVDEICANVIIHSPREKENHIVEVSVRDESDGIAFEIKDEGELFDINTYEVPEIEDLIKDKRKGGLGIMLVKKIMDKIEFRKENNYTICRLFKKVSLVKA